jgi:hypothetical protein
MRVEIPVKYYSVCQGEERIQVGEKKRAKGRPDISADSEERLVIREVNLHNRVVDRV